MSYDELILKEEEYMISRDELVEILRNLRQTIESINSIKKKLQIAEQFTNLASIYNCLDKMKYHIGTIQYIVSELEKELDRVNLLL